MSRIRSVSVPLLVVLFTLSLLNDVSIAGTFNGTVVGVIDGDTIDVLHNGQAERIRLNGIDCPEKGQPFGKKAKQFTSSLVFGKEVTVKPYKRDRHGRTVADVLLKDRNVSQEITKAGFAWWYRKYSKDRDLQILEAEAREAKRGLWADPNPMPPWEARHPKQKDVKMLSAGAIPLASSPAHDPNSAPIIGNRKTQIYHRPDCPNYTGTAPKNRKMFTSPAEAAAAGYHLAGNCP